jgi:hypothetical protein
MDPDTGSSHAFAIATDDAIAVEIPAELAGFRQRRIDIYLRSARSHALKAAMEQETAELLERRGQPGAKQHRKRAADHRSKAARHRLLAERYSPI